MKPFKGLIIPIVMIIVIILDIMSWIGDKPMPRGAPDGGYQNYEAATNITDLGSLANYLWGFAPIDGRGRMIFMDTFNSGLGAWSLSGNTLPSLETHDSNNRGYAFIPPYGLKFPAIASYAVNIRVSAADNDWHGIAWSPQLGIFAAVASNGVGNRVMTSPDGITWTIRASAADNDWRGIAWSPQLGIFAAVAISGVGNRVMTSPDGINWTSRASAANNQWFGIAWSPQLGIFAAVASDNAQTMTSPDGITWTIRAAAANNQWRGIAWSPQLGIFAAVAITGVGNRVMTSPDGINWTIRASAADNDWNSIVWSPQLGIFAAVAFSGVGNRVMTSPDGINWTSRVSAADNNWYGIAWSPQLGIFAAVAWSGAGNRVMTSPDGINWTIRASAADNGWLSIAWSPSKNRFASTAFGGIGNRVQTIDISETTSTITRRLILGKTGRFGVEAAVPMRGQNPKMYIFLNVKPFGGQNYIAAIYHNEAVDRWYLDVDGFDDIELTVMSGNGSNPSPYWVQVKIVGDWTTGKYVRAIIGETEYDISQYSMRIGATSIDGLSEIQIQAVGVLDTSVAGYLGYVLSTRDEP